MACKREPPFLTSICCPPSDVKPGTSTAQTPATPSGSGRDSGSSVKQCAAHPPDSPGHRFLPTVFTTKERKLQRTSGKIPAFIEEDLSVKRLNKIHGWLWMVGRPQAARPLHRQLIKSRKIIATEQADLHLTWNASCIYIKPFPRYLLCKEFWDDYICNNEVIYQEACGFLLSYSWLIRYESDFLIATKGDGAPYLLPVDLFTWDSWKTFIGECLDRFELDDLNNPRGLDTINKRYQYGELRLSRINKIYRFAPLLWFKYLFRGYHNDYQQYNEFFSQNFAWLIIAFAYVTVVLTAMQVGLALDDFKGDSRLTGASYGFSVFCMIMIIVVLGLGLLLFFILFISNLWATAVAHTKRSEEGKSTMQRKGKSGQSREQRTSATTGADVASVGASNNNVTARPSVKQDLGEEEQNIGS